MLVVSVLLGLMPLVGIGLIFYQTPALTVDNLFMSLMLLAVSGIFMLNAAAELKQRLIARKTARPQQEPKSGTAKALSTAPIVATVPAGAVETHRGVVREVQFYEAPVGVPNKSIVTLQLNGANSRRMLAFEGDLRNALPVGKKVEISVREHQGVLDLQSVNYV